MVKTLKQIAELIELPHNRRKGVGYMIEAIIATVTIFIFAFGQSPAEPVQDWNQFQNEITANDLSYTLKQTGDITPLLKRQETGSLQTAVSSMTEEEIEISGTIENLPLNDASIGVNAVPSERHTDSIRDVQSGDRCEGDLEEINQQSGTSIKRTEDPGQHAGEVLYFADTDPDIAGGFNNIAGDYDSLWVDNGTRCQFSASEGPYYIDEFFKWNTSSTNSEYYDFKNVSGTSNEFTYFNATLAVRIQQEMNKPINDINTDQQFDMFKLSDTDLNVYDLAVFKRNEAIDQLDANPDQAQKTRDFMEDKPVLFLANLTENDIETGFMSDTGVKWIDLGYTSSPANASFGKSAPGTDMKTYFRGVDGNISKVKMPPGGKISSSNQDTFMDQKQVLYSDEGRYQTDPWNATDYNMQQVDPDNIEGKPSSSCYTAGPSTALTKGSFSFPREDSGGTINYDVINSEIGTPGNCDNVRALSIDYSPENSEYDDSGEGPFLDGEEVTINGRQYEISISGHEAAEFVFSGNDSIELLNYRRSYEGIPGGSKMARMAYKEDYTKDDRKMIVATAYWLLDDSTEFGDQEASSVSTTVLGSVNQNSYMPYKLAMRWR